MGDPQVLIVGAGPTGLLLAIWLAKAGVPFRLIDKNPVAGEASRAMVLQARTLEYYRQLGIAEEVIDHGFRLAWLNLRKGSRIMASVDLGNVGREESPYPFALSYPQDDHEKLLGELLARLGVTIERNCELVRFTQTADGVQAVLRKNGVEQTCDVSYLCGCDGAHSVVRQGLDVGFPGGTYQQLFYVADVEATGEWKGSEINGYIGLRTFCAAFPIRSPGMYRFIGLASQSLSDAQQITFEDVRASVEEVTDTRVTKVNWFSTYKVHHRVAQHFQRGRVFLAGDAGHVHSPAGGQGMNTGIGDAVNLAWKLAAVVQGRASATILDSYEPERIPFARSLVHTTDRFFEMFTGAGFLSRVIRGLLVPWVLPIALRFKAVRRAQFRLVSQTRIAYHDSPLNHGTAGRLQAGDRLPWVDGADNFAPLASLDWQLHVYGEATSAVRDLAARRHLPLHQWTWSGEALRAGLAQNALYLVRPDGHIGMAAPQQDVAELTAYLDRWGIVAR